LVLVAIIERTAVGTTPPNIPIISGLSSTWTQVITYIDNVEVIRRITVFSCVPLSSQTGALTFNFSGQQQFNATWHVVEFSGTVLSGTNGSDAIVQTGTAVESAAAYTGITVTLSTFYSPHNAAFGVVRCGMNANITAGSGFTEISEVDQTSTVSTQTQFKINSPTVDWSWASVSNTFMAVAMELKALPSPFPSFRLT